MGWHCVCAYMQGDNAFNRKPLKLHEPNAKCATTVRQCCAYKLRYNTRCIVARTPHTHVLRSILHYTLYSRIVVVIVVRRYHTTYMRTYVHVSYNIIWLPMRCIIIMRCAAPVASDASWVGLWMCCVLATPIVWVMRYYSVLITPVNGQNIKVLCIYQRRIASVDNFAFGSRKPLCGFCMYDFRTQTDVGENRGINSIYPETEQAR